MRHQRYVISVFVVLAVLVGITLRAALVSLFDQFAWVDSRLLGFVPVTALASVIGGAGTLLALTRNVQAITYADEVIDELLQVTWPSRDEAVRGATTVVVASMFMAALIGGYDVLWKNVALYLYR
jgi:preprotein translocase SecE subunit